MISPRSGEIHVQSWPCYFTWYIFYIIKVLKLKWQREKTRKLGNGCLDVCKFLQKRKNSVEIEAWSWLGLIWLCYAVVTKYTVVGIDLQKTILALEYTMGITLNGMQIAHFGKEW